MKTSSLFVLGLAAFAFTACGNTVNTGSGQSAVRKDLKAQRDARVLSRIRFARTGGGAMQFEVKPFGKSYRILKLETLAPETLAANQDTGADTELSAASFVAPVQKKPAKLISLDPVSDVLLVQGLDEVFKGNLRFVSAEEQAGQFGGTWTELRLYSKTAPVVAFTNPKPSGTGFDEFLINLENRVREDGIRNGIPERGIRKKISGCAGLTGESILGTFEEKDEHVGCGWAGTVSEIKNMALIQAQVFHYEGVDETSSGGIVAQASKSESVEYTLHLDACILEQTKNQVTTYSKINETHWSNSDLTQVESLELAVCTDAQCQDFKKNAKGAPETHVLTKRASAPASK